MVKIYVTVSLLKSKFQQLLVYVLPLNLLPEEMISSTDEANPVALEQSLIGTLVAVPLGKSNKLQAAIIVELNSQQCAEHNMKEVAKIISKEPALSLQQLKLAKLIAWRYQCSLAHALSLFLLPKEIHIEKIKSTKSINKSSIPKYQRYIAKIIAELDNADKEKLQSEPILTAEQKTALQKINISQTREFLLHGVTGSGKTEIYLQLAKESIANNKNCLILVPEINLSYPMIQAFSLRFQNQCGIWHSQMSEGEKSSCRSAIKEGKIKILIGTRSALFSNLDNLGLIVIDEEHDSSYQSETIPHYASSSIARLILREQQEAKLILASATPAVNTYYRAQQGKCNLIELKERVFSVNLPKIDIVDLRQEPSQPNKLLLAKRTEQAISNTLNLGQQVLLLLNRRGYNICYLCASCGAAVKCERCDFRLVYHQSIEKLLCHYCGKSYEIPKVCPNCQQAELNNFGFGTEKLEEYLQQRWPNAKIARLDQDVSQKKALANRILSDFKHGEYQILLGTQMIAKGHDFSNISLVVILSIDSLLAMPDYLAEERCFQLITQAAGRAGRKGQASLVLLQTFDPEQTCLQAAIHNNYQSLYTQQLALRKRLALPPYSALGLIKLQFKKKQLTKTELKQLSQFAYSTLQKLSELIKQEKPSYTVRIWPLTNQSIRKINQEYSLTMRVSAQEEVALAYLYHQLLQCKLGTNTTLSLYLDN